MDFTPELIEPIAKAKHLVVLTGAGVSQESGIPTFRDAQTGLWEKYDPQQLASLQAFTGEPDLVWGWYEWRRAMVLRCQPNPAHYAIAALERIVDRLTLVTQNVDDLHERAGSHDVIRLHGSLHHPRCRACGRPHNLPLGVPAESDSGRHVMPPRCGHCGDRIRPGVVWFGEDLPDVEWKKAQTAAASCDVFLCIGTSALVYPAALLPLIANDNGACLIQINPGQTELDRVARYTLTGKAGEVMQQLLQALTAHDSEHRR